MSRLVVILVSIISLLPPAATAEERKAIASIAVEWDENDHPIVEVMLHDRKMPDRSRTLRFVLDTGASTCVIDRTVATDLFWNERPDDQVETVDSVDATVATRPVILKRVEIGGIVRDDVAGMQTDLHGQMGLVEDRPVDGILGMTFLKGTRFVVDPGAARITWWGPDIADAVSLPLTYLESGLPVIGMHVNGRPVSIIVDTGSSGSLDLPDSLRRKGDSSPSASEGLSGETREGVDMILPRLDLGPYAWLNLSVGFVGGVEAGRIGQGVLAAAPAGFDFVNDRLTLVAGAGGVLPSARARHHRLPLKWDRSTTPARLVVVVVHPGSALEKGGFAVGDELIRVGSLTGAALTRKAVQDFVARGTLHAWLVRRNGKEVELQVRDPEPDPAMATLAGSHTLDQRQVRRAIVDVKAQTLEEAAAAVDNLYVDSGYPTARTTPTNDPVTGAGLLTTEDGGLYKVGTVDIVETDRPKDDPADPAQHKTLVACRSGERFSRAKVRASVEALGKAFDAAGYGTTLVIPLTDLDGKKHVVNLTFEIERGRRHPIVSIEVLGAQATSEAKIRDLLGMSVGSLYSAVKHRQARKRLESSGLFDTVDIRLDVEKDLSKPAAARLVVEVKEKAP